MIHDEFAFDGYLDDGVEDVNMGELLSSYPQVSHAGQMLHTLYMFPYFAREGFKKKVSIAENAPQIPSTLINVHEKERLQIFSVFAFLNLFWHFF